MGKRGSSTVPDGVTGKRHAMKAKVPEAVANAIVDMAVQKDAADNMCLKVLAHVHDAVKVISDDPIFVSIAKVDPLKIGEGGVQRPFDQSECTSVLSTPPPGNTRDHFYICGGNFMWQSFTWLVNHRVPINMGQVRELQRYTFKHDDPPNQLGFNVVVALDSPSTECMRHKGAMQRISTPEPIFAVLFAMEKAIKEGLDESIRMRWRHLLLTAPFQFEVHPTAEDRFWRSQNLRQHLIEVGLVSHLSCRQWVYDVVGFKASKEKELGRAISSVQLAKLYADNVKFAGGNNHVLSDSFIDSAATVHKRVLSLPVARHWLEWAEEHMLGHYPFSTISALQALVNRAQTCSRITWAVWGITDLYRMELINMGELTGKQLNDYRKSYIEVLNLKIAMRDECIQTWLPSLGLKTEYVNKLQEVFADFGSVRAMMTAYPGESVDTTWMVNWPESAVKIAELLEDFVYSTNWDPRYRDAIRSKHKIAEFMEYESVQAKFVEIQDQLRTERATAETTANQAASASSGGTTAAGNTPGAADVQTGFDALPIPEQEHWTKYPDKLINTYAQ